MPPKSSKPGNARSGKVGGKPGGKPNKQERYAAPKAAGGRRGRSSNNLYGNQSGDDRSESPRRSSSRSPRTDRPARNGDRWETAPRAEGGDRRFTELRNDKRGSGAGDRPQRGAGRSESRYESRGEGTRSGRGSSKYDSSSSHRPVGRSQRGSARPAPRSSGKRDEGESHFAKPRFSENTLNVVVGRNSVLEVLKTHPARVQTLWIALDCQAERRLGQITDLAEEAGIRVQRVPSTKLESRLEQWLDEDDELPVHQGVLAEVLPKAQPTIHELASKLKKAIANGEKPLIFALDKVTDPRNFGAILRVADGAGAMAVLTTERHSASMSPAVAKTASGAEATVDVVTVPNLVQGLDVLKKAGGWAIGAAGEATATYLQHKFETATILVMGNEERGLGRVVTAACDGLVKIPMRGQVESLNVAAATAVLAYHIQTQLITD